MNMKPSKLAADWKQNENNNSRVLISRKITIKQFNDHFCTEFSSTFIAIFKKNYPLILEFLNSVRTPDTAFSRNQYSIIFVANLGMETEPRISD